MSEQEKNTTGASANAPAASQTTDPNEAVTSAEARKTKKRSGAKATPSPEAGDEPAKRKRARASSGSSKDKNVLPEALPAEAVQPAAIPRQGGSAQSEPSDLPSLPPAPVPTPEGIAFLQQHMAFQSALEQWSDLNRARLERTRLASRANPAGTVQDQGKPSEPPSEAAWPMSRETPDLGAPGATQAAKPSITKAAKAKKENSIEAGPELLKAPVTGADLQAVHDAEDARLLRRLLERSRALRERGRDTPAAEPAAAVAQSDVGTLRMIRDAATRKLGLAVLDRNRHEVLGYKAEFDRLAPDLDAEAQAASAGIPGADRQPGVLLDKADDSAARLNAIPESVLKRFLKVDSDYFFPDRSPAFVDRGARLATRGEHPEVVAAFVEIAKERGWNSVTVKGSEAFRRAAWMEAVRNGLQVAGYKPTELDLTQVKQREPTNMIEAGAVRGQGGVIAKLENHALDEKLSAFANERPTLVVKKYPDLVQAYALLDAARKFAEVHMPGHEAQFVAIGKELIKQQLKEGKAVIGPKVHSEQIDHSRGERNKSGVTVGTATQSEVLVRDR